MIYVHQGHIIQQSILYNISGKCLQGRFANVCKWHPPSQDWGLNNNGLEQLLQPRIEDWRSENKTSSIENWNSEGYGLKVFFDPGIANYNFKVWKLNTHGIWMYDDVWCSIRSEGLRRHVSNSVVFTSNRLPDLSADGSYRGRWTETPPAGSILFERSADAEGMSQNPGTLMRTSR